MSMQEKMIQQFLGDINPNEIQKSFEDMAQTMEFLQAFITTYTGLDINGDKVRDGDRDKLLRMMNNLEERLIRIEEQLAGDSPTVVGPPNDSNDKEVVNESETEKETDTEE